MALLLARKARRGQVRLLTGHRPIKLSHPFSGECTLTRSESGRLENICAICSVLGHDQHRGAAQAGGFRRGAGGREFIGVIFKDEKTAETSYAFNMAILEMDLPEPPASRARLRLSSLETPRRTPAISWRDAVDLGNFVFAAAGGAAPCRRASCRRRSHRPDAALLGEAQAQIFQRGEQEVSSPPSGAAPAGSRVLRLSAVDMRAVLEGLLAGTRRGLAVRPCRHTGAVEWRKPRRRAGRVNSATPPSCARADTEGAMRHGGGDKLLAAHAAQHVGDVPRAIALAGSAHRFEDLAGGVRASIVTPGSRAKIALPQGSAASPK